MHVLYIYCFLSDNVLSFSSRTAIDELECRARSCFCLSLNKLFVVVDITGNLLHNKAFKTESVSLSRAVMRNIDVIFTVKNCVLLTESVFI